MLRQAIAVQILEYFDNAFMHALALGLEQAAVGDFVRQRVTKAAHRAREELDFEHQARLPRRRKAAAEIGLLEGRDALQELDRDLAADNRRGLDQRLDLGRKPVDARCDQRFGARRDVDLRIRLAQLIAAEGADQHARLDQRAHHLLDEERIAIGARREERAQAGELGCAAEELTQHGVGELRRKRRELHARRARLPELRQIVPRGDEKEERLARRLAHQAADELERLGVEPVKVFADQYQRLLLA